MRPGAVLLGVYAAAIYAFIFAPVVVLVLFSFQESRLPIPPFDGPSLRWYEDVLADRRLMSALRNSLIVATGSAAAATFLGFLAAWGLARRLLPAEAFARLAADAAADRLLPRDRPRPARDSSTRSACRARC